MKSFVLIFLSVIFYLSASAQCSYGRYNEKIFSQTKATKNILYHRAPLANGGMKNVLMDVYEPLGDTVTQRPLIIFMHGGAYWKGSKNDPSQVAMANEFAKMGYVYCNSNYRLELSPVSLLFPNMMLKAVARGVQDMKTLVKYFFYSARHEGNPFGIDTTKVFLCGSSAGAFNALHTVFLDEEDSMDPQWTAWMEEAGGGFGEFQFIDFGKKIKGVVNINGALGDKSYMDNNHTPFLSVHNIRDPQVPFNRGKPYGIESLMKVDGSNVLHAKASELGIYNPFYIIPDDGHTSYSDDIFNNVVQPYFDSTVYYMKEFFAKVLDVCNKEEVVTPVRNVDYLSLDIFPNPVISQFNVQGVLKYLGKEIGIFDYSGKEIYRSELNRGTFNVKEIGLSPGLYFVRIINDEAGEMATGKLVVVE